MDLTDVLDIGLLCFVSGSISIENEISGFVASNIISGTAMDERTGRCSPPDLYRLLA